MSFLGLVSFSRHQSSAIAREAVNRWLAVHTRHSAVERWTTPNAAIEFHAFALAGSAPLASVVRDAGVALVGDVPMPWKVWRAPGFSTADLPQAEFAFGTWSDVDEALTLYRCFFGGRAVFHASENGRWFAFASLPEPLQAIPGVRTEIDERALAAHLVAACDSYVPAEATTFTRLKRLPAAHRLRVTRHGATQERYWRLPERAQVLDAGVDDPEVPRHIRRLLDAAVVRRIGNATRVGTQLSGGLDSSAVTALADVLRGPATTLTAYSLRPRQVDGSLTDPWESELADLVIAQRPDIASRVIPHDKARRPYYLFDAAYLARPLPEHVFMLGGDHRMFDAAADDECELLLTGWGGDQMVSARGTLHLLAMIAERRWRAAAIHLFGDGPAFAVRRLTRDVARPLWADTSKARWSAAIGAQLMSVLRSRDMVDMVREARFHREPDDMRQRRRARLSQRSFQIALEVQDWLAQYSGVAVRHPLLDRTLVEHCDRLPPEWFGLRDVTRRGFRAAVHELLPRPLLERHKAPLTRVRRERGDQYWTLHLDALRALSRSGSPLEQYVDLPALVDCHVKSSWPEDDSAQPIWQLGGAVLTADRFLTMT